MEQKKADSVNKPIMVGTVKVENNFGRRIRQIREANH